MVTKKSVEKTSPRVATKASAVLRSPTSTPAQKSTAASALRQAAAGVTSPAVASKASKQLAAEATTLAGKSIAASDLTQAANKKRR